MSYKRVLLKLSGEALMGGRQYGIDPLRLSEYANDIKGAIAQGIQIAIVIGGGNIFRGVAGASNGMDRVQGDHMGMKKSTEAFRKRTGRNLWRRYRKPLLHYRFCRCVESN